MEIKNVFSKSVMFLDSTLLAGKEFLYTFTTRLPKYSSHELKAYLLLEELMAMASCNVSKPVITIHFKRQTNKNFESKESFIVSEAW